jgi:hypothetical protein
MPRAIRVTGALDPLGVASTVGGSIAASLAGERFTLEIDIVAALEESHVDLQDLLTRALGEE